MVAAPVSRAVFSTTEAAVRAYLKNSWVDVILGHADLTADGEATSDASIAVVLALKRFAGERGADGERMLAALRVAARERANAINAARRDLLVADDGDINMQKYTAALADAETVVRTCYGARAEAAPSASAAESRFLELPPSVSLRAVSSVEGLAIAAREIHSLAARARRERGSSGLLVGLDTESRVQIGQSSPLSLLQIYAASSTAGPESGVVYLVDAVALRAELQASASAAAELWPVVRALFSPDKWFGCEDGSPPPSFEVLIFGPGDDTALAALHPAFSPVFSRGAGATGRVVDVQALAANDVRGSSIGLSQLCAELLGAPLLKAHRVSDWGRRPLTPAQAHYAALDAFVLPSLALKLRR
jgi:hypothetical protein